MSAPVLVRHGVRTIARVAPRLLPPLLSTTFQHGNLSAPLTTLSFGSVSTPQPPLLLRSGPPGMVSRPFSTAPSHDDLVHRLQNVGQRTTDPAERVEGVRQTWESFSPRQRQALIEERPDAVGNLDGIPFEDRIAANRTRIERDHTTLREQIPRSWEVQRSPIFDDDVLVGPSRQETARLNTLGSFLEPTETGQQRQFVRYEGGSQVGNVGRAVEVVGDLRNAENVVTLVPGMNNSLDTVDQLRGNVEEMRASAGPEHTAGVVWLGYESPQSTPTGMPSGIGKTKAQAGADGLASFTAALDQEIRPDARTTVAAHSYGTVVTARAIREHGVRPHNVVLMGSPGLAPDVSSVKDLGLPPDTHVYAVRQPGDLISISQAHGPDPAEFPDIQRIDQRQPGDPANGVWAGIGPHSLTGNYLRADSPSLGGVGHVIDGRYDQVPVMAPENRTTVQQESGVHGEYLRDVSGVVQRDFGRPIKQTTPSAPPAPSNGAVSDALSATSTLTNEQPSAPTATQSSGLTAPSRLEPPPPQQPTVPTGPTGPS